MRRLRFAFIVDKSGPSYVGGYEGKVWNLARRLAEQHEVRIYTSLELPSKTVERVLFLRLASQRLSPPSKSGRSLAHGVVFSMTLASNPFGNWQPDVVTIEAIPYLHLWSSSRWLKTLKAFKILMVDEAWGAYSYWPDPLASPSRHVIQSLLSSGMAAVDTVTATSSATQRSLVQLFGDKPSVQVLPDGVDSTKIEQVLQRPEPVPIYDFVSVGRLVSIKRQEDFVAALARLKRTAGWNGRAAIVGFGPLEHFIRERISSLGLGQNVELRTRTTDEDLYRILSASRVFVLCSEREGFSRATLEALAFGLPAIVARPPLPEVFGVSDFVGDGENGLYFDLGRIDQLAARMERLLNDVAARRQLSSRATAVRTSYDWNQIVRQFLQLIP